VFVGNGIRRFFDFNPSDQFVIAQGGPQYHVHWISTRAKPKGTGPNFTEMTVQARVNVFKHPCPLVDEELDPAKVFVGTIGGDENPNPSASVVIVERETIENLDAVFPANQANMTFDTDYNKSALKIWSSDDPAPETEPIQDPTVEPEVVPDPDWDMEKSLGIDFDADENVEWTNAIAKYVAPTAKSTYYLAEATFKVPPPGAVGNSYGFNIYALRLVPSGGISGWRDDEVYMGNIVVGSGWEIGAEHTNKCFWVHAWEGSRRFKLIRTIDNGDPSPSKWDEQPGHHSRFDVEIFPGINSCQVPLP